VKAVILQPMYLPWIGYFAMIDETDAFVFYDDVQFVERSWHRRNKVKMPDGRSMWLSVPIRKRYGQKINEARIDTDLEWRRKHWSTIVHAYGRAPFFRQYSASLQEIYEKEWEYLADLDITLVKLISEHLGLTCTRFVRSSGLGVSGQKTDRLINVLKKLGADEYVSGPAAKSYVELDKFEREGIALYWYEFKHPVYPQLHGAFLPYMSIVDLLFNVGDEALSTIRSGEEKSLRRENASLKI